MNPTAYAWRAAALVLLIALLGLAVSLELEQARQGVAVRALSESQLRQRLLSELSASVAEAEAAQRAFLLNHTSTETRSYQTARARIEPTLGRYADLLRARGRAALSPGQRQALVRLRTAVGTRLGELDSAFNVPAPAISVAAMPPSAPTPATTAAPRSSFTSPSTATQIGRDIAALSAAERNLSGADEQRSARLQMLTQTLIAALLALTVALLLIGARLLWPRRAGGRAEGDGSTRRLAELAALSRRLLQITEKEKAQLARSLHDELGGLLIAVKMDTSWLHKRWPNPTPEVQGRWERVFKVLDEGVDYKRRVVENLRPTLLDNMGLTAALRWITQEICGRAGLSHTESYPEDEPLLAEEVSILAFRLVQEALGNVVKHAHATDVHVEVVNRDQQLNVLVEDNGIGMEHGSSGSSLQALTLMQLRVSSLGGTLLIESGERGGTVLRARLPSQGSVSNTRPADRLEATRRASAR